MNAEEFREWIEKRYGDKEQIERPKSDIEILSEIRSEYNCFDEEEEPMYWALSRGIDALLHEPVHHGRWKQTKAYPGIIFCDECGEPFEKSNSSDKWNYCPNCGAKMDGGEE